MNNKFNSIVGKTEAEALKDLIFSRARERAQALNENVQSDIMDLARDSFVSKDNPFSAIAAPKEAEEVQEAKQDAIGFPQKNVKLQVKEQQNKVLNEQLTAATVQNNMIEARNSLSNKQSFMGALNFLNSQAAISLIRTRADKFEMLA